MSYPPHHSGPEPDPGTAWSPTPAQDPWPDAPYPPMSAPPASTWPAGAWPAPPPAPPTTPPTIPSAVPPTVPAGYPVPGPGHPPHHTLPLPTTNLPLEPPPTQRPPRRRRGRLILGIAGTLAVLCCGGGILLASHNRTGTDAKPTASAGKGTGARSHGPSTSRGTPSAPTGLNRPARDGMFEFVVSSVACGRSRAGDGLMSKKAQGQFCEVTLTVKNIGDQPRVFAASSQKAKGVDGATYGADAEAAVYASRDGKMILNNVNPGNAVSGMLVFDIPKDGSIVALELHDSPFSGGVTISTR
jgi:hypothetical protein